MQLFGPWMSVGAGGLGSYFGFFSGFAHIAIYLPVFPFAGSPGRKTKQALMGGFSPCHKYPIDFYVSCQCYCGINFLIYYVLIMYLAGRVGLYV